MRKDSFNSVKHFTFYKSPKKSHFLKASEMIHLDKNMHI